jgi:acyl transferase domain-containing protein
VLYPNESARESAKSQINNTAIAQPALFVIEYALAKLWMEWGIRPEAMIGHSVGEYVAACLAEVFSMEDALTLLAARGRLVEQLPGGAMLAVPLPQQDIHSLLGPELSLAAINAPSLCIVSGPTDAVGTLANQLADKDVQCRRLATSHAFHSDMMTPILEPFIAEVRKVKLKPPKIPYVSNVTGTWITAADATCPDYWARHLRQMVRFAGGLDELSKEPDRILLEVGPGRTLSSAAKRPQNNTSGRIVISSLPREHAPESATAVMLNGLGQLWLAGVEVHWSGFSARERRHRVPLPSYPFERLRYWIEPQQSKYNAEPCQLTNVGHHVMPALDCGWPELKKAFVAPRTSLEALITEAWQDVLGLEKVSIDDDFFKLGGHSLLASQVMARLRRALDLELPLHKLFETPTVADQAAYIETVRWVAQGLQASVSGTTDDREEDFL